MSKRSNALKRKRRRKMKTISYSTSSNSRGAVMAAGMRAIDRSFHKDAETDKERMSTVSEARQRHFGISKIKDAQNPLYGSAIGRLLLSKVITQRQYDALNEASAVFHAYFDGSPLIHTGNPKAMDMDKRGGEQEITDSQAERYKQTSKRYQGLLDVIDKVDVPGRHVRETLRYVCYHNTPTENFQSMQMKFLMAGVRAVERWQYGVK